jgi:hypothetical protein
MSNKERTKISHITDPVNVESLEKVKIPDYIKPYSEEELAVLLDSPQIKNMLKWLEKIKTREGSPVDMETALDDVTAYPNNDSQYMHIPGQHNIEKWLTAIRDILASEHQGVDRKVAIAQATRGWREMEIFDFMNWVRYYQEGVHLKYKFAQFFYGDADRGYMLPIGRNREESNPTTDIDFSKDLPVDGDSSRKELIEKQRNKIIGRLDSAEKLLRSDDGQLFSGKELESLLDAIYDLKKRIQLINKKSLSTRSYEDLIVRQANILSKNGFYKAAQALHSIAEEDTKLQSAPEPAQPVPNKPQDPKKSPQSNKMPPPASPAPPMQGSGSVGGLPSTGPGMPQNPPDSAPNNPPTPTKTTSVGINQFMKNLNKGLSADKGSVDDILEVQDPGDIVVEAQLAPEAPPPPTEMTPPPEATSPSKVPEEAPIEVTENKSPSPNQPTTKSPESFDSKIDVVFANITVDDVVIKLEDLAKVFKTREIPRQLAIVDMMLDSLGLASFFPSLSEATNKALESNNYISTRIEDIISKLRGAMTTHDIDLKGNEVEQNPEVDAVKNKLQQDADKEKVRKEMRKQQENEELEQKSKETPEIEVAEDLAPEAPSPPAPPAPPPPKPAV